MPDKISFDDFRKMTGGAQAPQPGTTSDALWEQLQQAKPSSLDAIWEGFKKGVVGTGQGLAQLAARMPSPLQDLGLMPGAKAGQERMQADIDQRVGAGAQAYEQNPARIAHPWAAGAGQLGGQLAATAPLMAIPGGAGPSLAGKGAQLAARAGLGSLGGAAGAATQPVVPQPGGAPPSAAQPGGAPIPQGGPPQPQMPGGDFWRQKAAQAGIGALIGAGVGTVAGAIGPQVTSPMMEVAQKYPALGRMALGYEGRSPDSFQRAFANHVLEPIGGTVPRHVKPGDKLLEAVDDQLNEAYNAIKPQLKFDGRDPSFTQGLQQASNDATQLLTPAKATQYTNFLKQWVEKPLKAGGVLTGDGFKKIDGELGKFARRFEKPGAPGDDELLAEQIRNVQKLMRDTLANQNGTALGDQLRRIDMAYRRSLTMDRAAARDTDARRVFTPHDIRMTFGSVEQRRQLSQEETLMRRFSEVGEDMMDGVAVPQSKWIQILTDIAGASAGSAAGHAIGHPIYGAAAGVTAARAAAPAIGAVGRLTQGPQARELGAAVSRAAPVAGAGEDRDGYVSPSP